MVNLSRAFHPAPFSLSPFLCPDAPAPSAGFHSFTFTSDHIPHLHASPHPVCKLLPHLPGPGPWPHVHAFPLIFFHTETRETAVPTTGLCQPHLQTPSSFSEEDPPPFLAWTSPWRCLLAAYPPQPRCSPRDWNGGSKAQVFFKSLPQGGYPGHPPQPLPGFTAGENNYIDFISTCFSGCRLSSP